MRDKDGAIDAWNWQAYERAQGRLPDENEEKREINLAQELDKAEEELARERR